MTSKPVVRFLDRTTAPHIFTLTMIAAVPALSMSVFLPSLNSMTEYFGTSYALMQFSVSAYLAATAFIQVFIGPVSDRFGRRPVVLWGLAIFMAATVGTIFAPTVEWFLTFRLIQAVVATGMVLSRAIVRDMLPADEAASMIGYVVMGMALVPMIGPMIGGVLDQFFGWQSSFVLLLACGAFVWAISYADLGETIVGDGQSFGQQVRTYPELLSSPRFWGYVGCASFGSGAFFAFLGGASFVAAEVFGLSPLLTGMALGAPAIGYALGNGLSGRYSVRFGINRMVLAGTTTATFGMSLSLILTLLGVSHPLIFFAFCSFVGLGNGIMLPSANAGILSVRPHLAGTASGLGGAIMIGGGAALAALAGSLLTVETGTIPLQVIMLCSSAASVPLIFMVMRRAKRVA